MAVSGARRLLVAAVVLLSTLVLVPQTSAAPAPGFRDTVVLRGLSTPTAVRFARDGRVFVAEKSGRIKVFSDLSDTTPALFADLSAKVHDYWDRGMLGLALPPDFPATRGSTSSTPTTPSPAGCRRPGATTAPPRPAPTTTAAW
jgi:glucose/arabinose dehydrogenase